MKMKAGTRVVFSIYIVIVLAICAALIISALGLVEQRHAEELVNGYMNTSYKYIWVAAAAVMFIAGVALLFFGTGKHEPPTVALEEGADGGVRLTIAAIEELVQRYLGSLSGIIVQKTEISSAAPRTIKIMLGIAVKPGTSVPEITGTIKSGVVEYIDSLTGLSVSGMDIKILPLAGSNTPAGK